MTVETTQFQFSHGHKPRGFGQWMFEFVCVETGCSGHVVSVSGSFSQAKAKAVRVAKAQRAVRVEVMP